MHALIYRHTCINYILIYSNAYLYSLTHIHTYIHTHIHIHTHTQYIGDPLVNQLTVTPGYKGTEYGQTIANKKSPAFTVQNQIIEVYKLVALIPSTVVSDTSSYFRIVRNDTTGFNSVSNTGGYVSPCIAWNSYDYEVEAAISSGAAHICSQSSIENCVTVTRDGNDPINPGGYTFYIYLENVIDSSTLRNYYIAVDTSAATATACAGTSDPTLVSLSRVVGSTVHTPYTKNVLPLALPISSTQYINEMTTVTLPTTYKGSSFSRRPIYKVDGNSWAVQFDTNLGDLPLMIASPTKYLTCNASLVVYDNIVQGNDPLYSTLTGLHTGIQYNALMQAYTRGSGRGYSNFTASPTAAVPSGAAPEILNFQVTSSTGK